MAPFLDHQQFGDPPKKETGFDYRKSFVPENISQVRAVGKALEAFGYVAIDFMIAVQDACPTVRSMFSDPSIPSSEGSSRPVWRNRERPPRRRVSERG